MYPSLCSPFRLGIDSTVLSQHSLSAVALAVRQPRPTTFTLRSTPSPSSLFQICDYYSYLEVKPISGRPPETSHNDGIQLNGIFIVASYAGPKAGGPCSQNR